MSDNFKDFIAFNGPIDITEAFCILMDWQYDPEDVVSIEPVAKGCYYIELRDGASYVYDYRNDNLID